MNEHILTLGIDTSNYKTSLAVTDEDGHIIADSRRFLEVKKGERGLRQSDALFQHVHVLPHLLEDVMKDENIRRHIRCVSVSSRPRPYDDSYMPVFMAGVSAGRTVAASLGVPLYMFSHQEGHVEAVRRYCAAREAARLICFHFSGGTTEAILLQDSSRTFEIVGGSRDISYGQLLDRTGVAMGLEFPCGHILDQMAADAVSAGRVKKPRILSAIKVKDGHVNLSGTETQLLRSLGEYESQQIICELFQRMAFSIYEMTMQLAEKYHINSFLYAGGVSSSMFLREFLQEKISKDFDIFFGKPELSSDNAVGTALLGGKAYGAETGNGDAT